MCGIYGLAGAWAPSEITARLAAMRRHVLYRGPDGEGVETGTAPSLNWGIGHVRMAIIDPHAGQQPMVSDCERYTLSFNGAIYNYLELRSELQATGRKFRTQSDTEVLLQAFAEWGGDCCRRLDGMYAFATWDRKKEELFLARDPYGEKPLFYEVSGKGIQFASALAAIPAANGGPGEIDRNALADYLLFRYVPAPKTLEAGIAQLPAGCSGTYSRGEFNVRRHYADPVHRPDASSARADPGVLLARLESSVSRRLRSDVPVGIFLSGGIDSATIAALVARQGAEAMHAYTVEFDDGDDERYSEVEQARATAEALGMTHDCVRIGPEDMIAAVETAAAFRSAPLSEQNDVAMMILAQRAREDVRVVLCGEGADEVFGGYPRYRTEGLVRRLQALGLVPPAWLAAKTPYALRRVGILLRALGERDFIARQAAWFGALTQDEARRLGPDLFVGKPEGWIAREFVDHDLESDHPLHSAMRFDRSVWLSDNLLLRGDAMTMAAPVEMRQPYLEKSVVEFAAACAPRDLISGGQAKLALRRATRDLLPDAVRRRRKNGFRTPFHEWIRGSMRDFIGDILRDGTACYADFLDRREVGRYLDEHLDKTRNHEKVLWLILALELYLRKGRGDGTRLELVGSGSAS